MSFPKLGEIWTVNLDPVVGTEIAKTRPAVIIFNDIANQYSDHVTLVPITSGSLHKIYPFEVPIKAGFFGLTKDSKIAGDQIRSVDKQRLTRKIGVLDDQSLESEKSAIRIHLNL